MRITFVLESFKGGGKERRCLQLIQGLNAQGYKDIQVIIINGNVDYPELFNTSAEIVILDRKNKSLSWNQTYKEVKKHIIQLNPDIVQAWGVLSMGIISFIRLTRKFKFICANVADCNKSKWYSPQNIISQFSYFVADAVVGNSNAGLQAYKVPKKKAHCIYNGFNENRYKLAENIDEQRLREELNINTKHLVAMFARIDYYKDPDAFIALARNVLKQRNDVTFLAVGKGLYYDKYRKIPAANENIRFIGFRSDVERIMSITDVSILFSNYNFHKEGVSNSIMESMALGTPVIATNDGGSPEIIEHGVNGYLVDENNIDVATNYINTLLDNPIILQTFSRNAKETVHKRFLLETMVAKYLALYEKLIKRH